MTYRIFFCSILLASIPTSFLEELRVGCAELRQPKTDLHDYHVAAMHNGVEYLLVRDHAGGNTEGAFGLLVPKGSLGDSSEVLGLAHLAEHAFVRGSQRFPGPGDFDSFLAAHGGNFNAYTDAERTVLFFSIPGAVESIWMEALSRFASFFEAPLLQGWEQDIDMIDDEFAAQRADPSRRFWDLLREIAFGRDVSFGQLWTGNKLTLEAQNKSVVQARLYDHIRSSFCAPSVKMLLSGPFKSLQGMADMLESVFEWVPICRKPQPVTKPLLPPSLGHFVQAEVQAPPELWVWLPLHDLRPHRSAQPASFLKYLFRDQGAKGLAATLTRDLRLVSSMVPGIDSFHDVSWIYLRMGLTPQGNAEVEKVLAITLSYFRRLSRLTISEVSKLYEAFVAARTLSFDFPARQIAGAELAIGLLETWSETSSSCDIVALNGGLVPTPNASFVLNLLQSLNLELRANMLYASRKPCKHECRSQTWYRTPYSISPLVLPASDIIDVPSIPRPAHCAGNRAQTRKSLAEEPQQFTSASDNNGMEVWLRTAFSGIIRESPRFSVRVRIQMQPVPGVEAEVAALIHLEAVRERIKSEIIPALGGELCSLGISVNRVLVSSWEIRAEGIDASLLPDLFSLIAAPLSQPLMSYPRESLQAWRRRAMSRVADRSNEMAFDVAEEVASEIVAMDAWTRADLLKVFRTDAVIDSTFSYSESFMGAIVYIGAPGLSRELADAAIKAFSQGLKGKEWNHRTSVVAMRPETYIAQFGRVASIGSVNVALRNPISDDVSSAVVLSRVLPATSVKDETALRLLAQILDDIFSRGLRFAAEDVASVVGYIVACKFRRLAPGVVELRVVAQGTKPSSELLGLLVGAQAGIVIELEKLFDKSHEAEVSKWADGLVRIISSPATDLGDAVDRDWNELWTRQHCFARREQAVAFLQAGAEVVTGTLRNMWTNFLSANVVTVRVFVLDHDHITSTQSFAGPLHRVILETEVWTDRTYLPVSVPCDSRSNDVGAHYGRSSLVIGIASVLALVIGLCVARVGVLRRSRRWKDL